MAVIRTYNEPNHKQYDLISEFGGDELEWEDDSRVLEDAWVTRYKHEANIINHICETNKYSKILELGAGVGELSKYVQENKNIIFDYTMVDKPFGKKQFDKRGGKGKFLIKDLNNNFDVSELSSKYDLMIMNDFLEHINNPSDVLQKCYDMANDDSRILISVPNWRMGHTFIYRGVFDFDNWIYTMYIHGWDVENVYPSPLICSHSPKLDSEKELPDNMIQSWNWYFVGTKRIENV